MKFEIQDYARTWTENLKLSRAMRPLKPVSIKKLAGMDETIDEMMILVSRETNYVLADLERMEIIRFLRIVESVKRLVKARNATHEEAEKAEGETAKRRSMK